MACFIPFVNGFAIQCCLQNIGTGMFKGITQRVFGFDEGSTLQKDLLWNVFPTDQSHRTSEL